MRLSDVINAPWAIQPEILNEIQSVYAAHARNEHINIAAVEARLGKPLANEPQGYTVQDGVAVIPIHGVIGKRMNMFSQISGGTSTQLIERDIKTALSDPKVNSILLHIDSPGGTVDGTQNLASVIRDAKTQKSVMAFADGTIASAAYWIGSAADGVVAASDTTQIGSIGVVATHTDYSKAEESQGIKTTEITAGKYKRIASSNAPLTKEGKEYIQDQVDQLYTIFVDEVAQNRGVDVDTVIEDMADGRVFLSKQAKKRGMIDDIASLETTINNMATGVWPMNKQVQQDKQPEPVAMTIETVKAEYPEIAQALAKEGAEQERARIQACEAAALAGHEAIVNAMKYDGKSSGQDVAMAIVQAEQKLRANHLESVRANAPQVVPLAAVPAIEKDDSVIDKSKPVDQWAQKAWDADENIRAEFGNFESYLAFEKAFAAGKVRVARA